MNSGQTRAPTAVDHPNIKRYGSFVTPQIKDESKYFSQRNDWRGKKRVAELLVQKQTEERDMPGTIFNCVKNGDLSKLQEMLKEDGTLIKERDACGASVIHVAYLLQQYRIGHWLVENFPKHALLGYSLDENLAPIPNILPLNASQQNDTADRTPQSCWNLFGRYKSNIVVPHNKELIEVPHEMMPYIGENILHMTIIGRNIEETRWLLDFYRDHEHSVTYGLEILLTANASGQFFYYGGNNYFGGYPLHFAVCSNDKEMFDLVLAYASSFAVEDEDGHEHGHSKPTRSSKVATKQRSMLGPNAIFMCDDYGNNALHLCAIHQLQDMYAHVKSVAEACIMRELRVAHAEATRYNRPLKIKAVFPEQLGKLSCYVRAGSRDDFKLMAPKTDVDSWMKEEARSQLERRLLLVLNRDLHSPLTLAAAKLNAVQGQVLDETTAAAAKKKVDMLACVLKEQKHVMWAYGPTKCSLVDLEGIDKPYNYKEYPELYAEIQLEEEEARSKKSWNCLLRRWMGITSNRSGSTVAGGSGGAVDASGSSAAVLANTTVVASTGAAVDGASNREVSSDPIRVALLLEEEAIQGLVTVQKSQHTSAKKRYGVIDWICVVNSTQAVMLPEIRKIVELKWERVGNPKFFQWIYLLVVLGCTIPSLFSFVVPPSHKHYPLGEIFAMILYPLLATILVWKCYHDLKDLYNGEFFHAVRGAANFAKRGRLSMLVCFIIISCLKISLHFYSARSSTPLSRTNDVFLERLMSATSFFVALGTLISWIYLFYFFMGSNGAPFVLIAKRILTHDMFFWFSFYGVVLIAFACPLSMLTNNGTTKPGYGILQLLKATYGLLQQTLNMSNLDPSIHALQYSLEADYNDWTFAVFYTTFFVIVNILMLNLLIALMNSTYSIYMTEREGLSLLEKYNILAAMERCMTPEELLDSQKTYAVLVKNFGHDQCQGTCEDENADSPHDKKINNQVKLAFEYEEFVSSWFEKKPRKMALKDRKVTLLIVDPQIDFHDKGGGKQATILKVYNTKEESKDPVEAAAVDAEDTTDLQFLDGTLAYQVPVSSLQMLPLEEMQPNGLQIDQINSGELKKGMQVLVMGPMYHPKGSLAVPGANEDSARIAEMIRINMEDIDDIFVTLDSHHTGHIANKTFWKNGDGDQPPDFTELHFQDEKIMDKDGKIWMPADDKMKGWCEEYLKSLKNGDRFTHTIWPDHCILGSEGHCVVPVINEVLQEWVEVKGKPVCYVMKGMNNRTEMFSKLEAEVKDPADPSTNLDEELLTKLKISDRLIVCGQAKSHCVNWTMRDIVKHWDRDMSRLFLLENGTSPVPGFEKEAEKFVSDIREKGVTITTVEKAFGDGTVATAAKAKSTDIKLEDVSAQLKQMAEQHAKEMSQLQKQMSDIMRLLQGGRDPIQLLSSSSGQHTSMVDANSPL